jgi:hypothetical protein
MAFKIFLLVVACITLGHSGFDSACREMYAGLIALAGKCMQDTG